MDFFVTFNLKIMNSKVPRIVGLLLLVPVWYSAFNPIFPDGQLVENVLLHIFLIVLILGLSYSILHRQDYPVQAIVTILIAEFIVYKLKTENFYRADMWLGVFDLYLGTILVLAGENGAKFFCFILSPIQNFLRNIGINVSIPIIAGVLVIPIGLIGLEFAEWWEEYRRLQRIRNR